MQWQPGADLKGVTTVYPDIIPQYIPFDYDKLAQVEGAKAAAKEKKAKSQATSLAPLDKFTTLLANLKVPPTLPVAIDPQTGKTIEEKNILDEQVIDLWDKTMEATVQIMNDPSMLYPLTAYLKSRYNQLQSTADAQNKTLELFNNDKEANPASKTDILSMNRRYQSDKNPYNYGQASLTENMDVNKYFSDRFTQLNPEERTSLSDYKTKNLGIDTQYYTTEDSTAAVTRSKVENTFNGLYSNQDVQRQDTKDVKFRIDNWKYQWNKADKQQKDRFPNKLTDSEYMTVQNNISSTLLEADKLAAKGNKEGADELRLKAEELVKTLYGQSLENAPLIVDSKGEIREDLMEDFYKKITRMNRFAEFVDSGTYEYTKNKSNMAGIRYLSDYIKAQKEDKEKADANTLMGTSLVINKEARDLKTVGKGLGKAVEDGDYSALNAQMSVTRAYFSQVIANPVVKKDWDRIVNELTITSSTIDNKKLQAVLRNKPEIASLLASAALAYKESGSAFFGLTAGSDMKNLMGSPLVLQQVVKDNLPDSLKGFTKELIDAFMGIGMFDKVWKTDIPAMGGLAGAANTVNTPIKDNEFYKFAQQSLKDGLTVPGAYKFVNMYSGKESTVGKRLEGLATLNEDPNEEIKTFMIVDGDLFANVQKGDGKDAVTEDRLLNDGKFGTGEYINLLGGIIEATAGSSDPTTLETNAYLSALVKFSRVGVDRAALSSLRDVFYGNGTIDLTPKRSSNKVSVQFFTKTEGGNLVKYMTTTVNGKKYSTPVKEYPDAVTKLGIYF